MNDDLDIVHEQDEVQVRDSRGDNRLFIDNMLIRDYGWLIGANTIAVYTTLAMYVDKRQGCYPSIARLEQQLCLSKPTIIQCMKLLKYLKIIDSVRIGKKCTNRYRLLDKKNWRKDFNVMLKDLTSGEVNVFNLTGKTVLLHRLNGFTSIVTIPNSNKTHSNKSGRKAPTDPNAPLDLKQFMEWCEKQSWDAYKIIGEWADTIKPAYSTYGEWKLFTDKNLLAAKKLIGVSRESMVKAYLKMKSANYLEKKDNLATLIKFI